MGISFSSLQLYTPMCPSILMLLKFFLAVFLVSEVLLLGHRVWYDLKQIVGLISSAQGGAACTARCSMGLPPHPYP